jgi:serine/threonine protein kinase
MGKVSASRDPLLGQVVGGRYEVLRLIGRGGMGAIYEVRNTRVGRSFAMKTLIGEAADDSEVLARFRREADVVARIKHPNIVEVIDWEALEDGSPCIILEYLHGEDLARRIREAAPLSWPMIGMVGDQILSALSVAHAANVIHRDLKPQNIFLSVDDSSDERAKLLDFGVSKIRDSRSLVTTDARLLGTPSYMSPEQAEGRHDDVGPGTDLWAMGAILYEMATGDLAFDGASMPAILYRICSKDAEAVDARRPDAPAAFAQLVRELLARDLAARICDADVARVRLREALANVAPDTRYSDRVLVPRGPAPTPLPTPITGGRRHKRQTGAHDKTVSSGSDVATANTVASGAFDKPHLMTPIGVGEVSANIAPVKRRMGMAIIVGMAAIATVVVAVVVATSRGVAIQDAAPPPAVQPKLAEPAPPVPVPVLVDAAVAVEIDAAPVPVIVEKKPPRTIGKKPEPPAPPPPVVVKPVEPVKPVKPKGCDQYPKDSPQYKLCVYGDGGGM